VNKIIIPRVESRNYTIRRTVFPYMIIFLFLNGVVNSKDCFKGNSLDTGTQNRSHPMCNNLVTTTKTTYSMAFSPKTKYTDWATANCRRNLVPAFVDRGVSRAHHGGSLTAVNLSILDRSRYFFFQVAPHLSSQGLSGPRSRPTVMQKIW
jgi:hypothetical protein